jgi:hypothetical protein
MENDPPTTRVIVLNELTGRKGIRIMFDYHSRRGSQASAAKTSIFAPVLKKLLEDLSILHEQFDVYIFYFFHGRSHQQYFITKYNYQISTYESYTRRQNLL